MNLKGRLCIITDTVIQEKYSHFQIAEMAVKGGADIIQFRDKTMPTAIHIETAEKILWLCRKNNVLFIVNDRVDTAMITGADGVHLGKEDIPVKDARKLLGRNKIIGGTANSLSDAVKREKEGADYIGYGHIYPTNSKLKTGNPNGIKNLQKIVSAIKIPVIAIGGINLQNIDDVAATGVHGAAVIGSVLKSSNPLKTIIELKRKLYDSKQSR